MRRLATAAASNILHEPKTPRCSVFALNNIAVMTHDEQPTEAEKMVREALDVSQKAGDLFGEVSALESMARFALWKKDFKSAQKNAQEGREKAQKEGMNDEVANCLLILSDVALAKGDIGQYRALRQQYSDMSDTLANTNLVHATQDLKPNTKPKRKNSISYRWNGNENCKNCAFVKKTVSSVAWQGFRGCCF